MTKGSVDHESGLPSGCGTGPLSRLLEALARPDGVATSLDEAPVLGPGDHVGRFEVVREIGRGGFGAVYEAVDCDLGRHVALKVLRPKRSRADALDRDLRREAEATARLDHPGIVTLFDAGTSEHGPFLVMELLRGETLARRLARGPVPLLEAVHLGGALARALAHAHARGVLHRDLKPGNVFLTTDGRVKVLDLGLAHLLEQDEPPQGGTHAYSAPELWDGGPADARADVFAVGAILFELATGRRALDPTWWSDGPSSPVVDLPPSWPLAGLVVRCLSADPGRRPADGRALELELERIERRLRRRRFVMRAGVAVAVLLAVQAALLIALTRSGRNEQPVRPIVAVAEGQGERGAPDDLGLGGLVASALEASDRIRVMPRGRLREVLRRSGVPEPAADSEAGQKALGAVGVKTLIIPVSRGEGDSATVELRGLDLEHGGAKLFAAREPTPHREDVPAAVDRLVLSARAALGEDGATLSKEAGVAAALAARLDAWVLYDQGRELDASFRGAEAIQLYRRAVELDPAMAPAQFRLALLGWEWALKDFDRVDLAARHADRARPTERELIAALAALHDGRADEAWSLARSVAVRVPDDAEVACVAGDLAAVAGDTEAAAEHLGRAATLAPRWAGARWRWAQSSVELRRGTQALMEIESAAALTAAERNAAAAKVLLQMGRRPEGIARARHALTDEAGDMHTRMLLASALAAEGDREGARQEITKARTSTIPGLRAISSMMETIDLVASGRSRDGLRAFDRGWQAPWIHPEMRAAIRATLLAAAGDDAMAREEASHVRLWHPWQAVVLFRIHADDALRALVGRMAPGTRGAALSSGLLAWSEGDLKSALRILRSADRRGLGWETLLHGQLAAELGFDDEALAAFAEVEGVVLPGSWEVAWLGESARAAILAARCRERLGRHVEARRGLQALVDRWRDAEPGHALAGEARALLQRLVSRGVRQ